MRKRPRTDFNQAAIVAALRAIGCEVFITSAVGGGVPDLFVYGLREGYRAIEVKTDKGKLTADQVSVFGRAPVCVVRSVAEALALFWVRG